MLYGGASLTQRSLRAAAWTFAGRGAGQFLRLASNLILARLLFPEAFGLMSMASVVLAMISLFADTGVRLALIQNPRGHERQFLDTAWIISICRGCVLFAVSWGLAGPMAQFYGKPEMAGLIRLISVSILLQGFENPAAVILTRELSAIRQTALDLVRQVGGAAVTIILAFALKSVWALAIGTVFGAVIGLIASYAVRPYMPALRWDRNAGSELLHFGKFIFVNTLITFCVMNGDRLILGRILTMEEMGYFSIAMNLALVIPLMLIQVCGQVAFPAIAAHSADRAFVQRVFLRTLRIIGEAAFPILAMLAVFGDTIVGILYEPRYAAAGPALQWMGVRSVFFSIAVVQGSVFLAVAKPKFETVSFGTGLIVMLSTMPWMAMRWGLNGACQAICLSGVMIAMAGSYWIVRATGVPARLLAGQWGRAAGSLAVIGALRLVVTFLWHGPRADLLAIGLAMAVVAIWYVLRRHAILGLLRGPQPSGTAPATIDPVVGATAGG